MTRRQAFALVGVAVVTVAAVALIWRYFAAPCYDPATPCGTATPVGWVFAGLVVIAAIGFVAAILSPPE